MITVFSTHITNRLRYIFELYFEELLNIPVSFTSDESVFKAASGVKINYSGRHTEPCPLHLHPHRLLFQTGVEYQNLSAIPCDEQLCLFRTSADSFLPFDPFAAGFYLVTRYEEYLERQFGKHGRYPSRHSILVRNQAIEQPVVNQWARLIADKIRQFHPGFQVPEPHFDFRTTIDVDNAWAYKHKSLGRLAGASFRSLLHWRLDEIAERFRVWSGAEPDPYDTYDYIRSEYNGNEMQLQFFFLVGKTGRYDRNVSPRKAKFRELVAELGESFQIGLHPSYRSNRIKDELLRERKVLEDMVGKPVISSRQHYLKLLLPSTYRRLIKAGISEDHTMGYPDCIGFRAGIAAPFWFYDLHREQKTALRVFPFQYMDISLRDYLNLSPEVALERIEKMMREVARSGGTFISLWHNESLSDCGRWSGWRKVFEQTTALALALKNEQHSA